jgi:hypothetical protein
MSKSKGKAWNTYPLEAVPGWDTKPVSEFNAPGWETKPPLSRAVQAAAAAAAMNASSAAGRQRPPMTPYLPPVTLASLNTRKVSSTPIKWSTVAGLPKPKSKRKTRKTRKTKSRKSRK